MRRAEFLNRLAGPPERVFIVAEAGVNHNGSLEMACRLVDTAIFAGADAVKFQTFKAENVISPSAPKAHYQIASGGAGESQLEMAKKLELPFEAFRQLQDYCRQKGLLFLSTPFDEESVDFLARLNIPAFKIPSGEITNLPFLTRIARTGKPIILSTGMSTLQEVRVAIERLQQAGNRERVLLHCVSNYPARPSDVNLRAMITLAEVFDVPVGYSDHTLGIEVAVSAVAMGACLIEKHFTLDRNLPGPDHQASLDPDGLTQLVRAIRLVESALGDGRKIPRESEREIAEVARKSLVAALDIPAGTRLTEESIAIKRPGTGLPPAMLDSILFRKAGRNILAGTLLQLEMLE